jgi:hypothetical protein
VSNASTTVTLNHAAPGSVVDIARLLSAVSIMSVSNHFRRRAAACSRRACSAAAPIAASAELNRAMFFLDRDVISFITTHFT